jgi:hypothetical protein
MPVPWEPWERAGAIPSGADTVAAGDLSPELRLWRAELLREIRQAMQMAGLSAAQQRLLEDCHLRGASIPDLARGSSRTPNAVRQELWALRRRLRAALIQEMGWEDADVGEYRLLFAAVRRRTGIARSVALVRTAPPNPPGSSHGPPLPP